MNNKNPMRANVVGYDWKTSWINEDLDSPTSKQILRDLNKKMHSDLTVGEILVIDREDHSFACEMFEVMAVFKRSGIVKLEYRGGAS